MIPKLIKKRSYDPQNEKPESMHHIIYKLTWKSKGKSARLKMERANRACEG